MRIAPLIESCACCIFCGKLGLAFGDHNRRLIFAVAAAVSVLAMVLTIFASLGVSTSTSILRHIYWVGGTTASPSGGVAHIYIGISMRFDTVDCRTALEFDVCERRYRDLGYQSVGKGVFERKVTWADEKSCAALKNSQACEACKSSLLTKSTIIVSIITQIPTITTDLQRGTRFGDVNCQATMGVISNIVSFASSMVSLIAFRQSCYLWMPMDFMGFSNIAWETGAAFKFLIVATLLKLFDAGCHLVVPTPPQRWRRPEATIKSVEEYMMQAPPSVTMDDEIKRTA